MINKTDLKPFRNGEIIKFLSNVLSILSENGVASLAGLQADVQQAYEDLMKAYKMERGSKITTSLVNLDKARDGYFVALRVILEQHATYHPEDKSRDKAARLLEIVTRHGIDLHRRSYQEQTAGMDDICELMDTSEDNRADLTLLGVEVYYTAMKTTNEEFDAKYLDRNSEYAAMPAESLADLRVKAEEMFKKLATHLNAHLILAEDPAPFELLSAEIGTLLQSYYDVIDRRTATDMPDDVTTDTAEELDADYEEAVDA